jgi:hypothetical protein
MNQMARELWHQIGCVAADLPRFVTAPLYRSWHIRWGATDAEVAAAMPGDDLLPGAGFCPTRAITIEAPPAAVWPWLVQVGRGRAGFYADDLLDNPGGSSLRKIDPGLQHLEVGPTASRRTSGCCGFHVPYNWSRPAYTAFEVVLMEFGDFPMIRRMLLGIKQRAESTPRAAAVP